MFEKDETFKMRAAYASIVLLLAGMVSLSSGLVGSTKTRSYDER